MIIVINRFVQHHGVSKDTCGSSGQQSSGRKCGIVGTFISTVVICRFAVSQFLTELLANKETVVVIIRYRQQIVARQCDGVVHYLIPSKGIRGRTPPNQYTGIIRFRQRQRFVGNASHALASIRI